MDECEVHAHPYLAQVWRRQGQPMKVPAAGDDHKFVVFGAVDYASGQVRWWQTKANQGEPRRTKGRPRSSPSSTTSRRCCLPTNRPYSCSTTNASYHKSHAVRVHWQGLAERLQPFFRPAYAPQLNLIELIERLWRYLQAKRACHRWWNDLDRRLQATETLLASLEVHFHADDGPAFRPAHNFW